MNNFLLLDTDVLIDFLRGHPAAIQLLETSNHEFWISAVSIAELYVGVPDGKEREVLDQLIGLLRVVEITTEIAQQAGLWRRKYGSSHGTGIMDALIAACADSLRTPLVNPQPQALPDAHGDLGTLLQIGSAFFYRLAGDPVQIPIISDSQLARRTQHHILSAFSYQKH